MAAAAAWATSQTYPPVVVIDRVFKASDFPNWKKPGLWLAARGDAGFINTGTGPTLIFDAVNSYTWDQGVVGRPKLWGGVLSGNGVFTRGLQNPWIEVDVRGCGLDKAAIRIEFCVVGFIINPVVSGNEGGWYQPTPQDTPARPMRGIEIDRRDVFVNGVTSQEDCGHVFILNPKIEHVSEDGIHIDHAIGTIVAYGTSEGNAGRGVRSTVNSNGTLLVALGLEVNNGDDFTLEGRDCRAIDCLSDSVARVAPGAKGCSIDGGAFKDVFTTGSQGTYLHGLIYDRFGNGGVLQIDPTTRCMSLRRRMPDDSIRWHNAPPSQTVLTVPAGAPYWWQNSTGNTMRVSILNGDQAWVGIAVGGVAQGTGQLTGTLSIEPGEALFIVGPTALGGAFAAPPSLIFRAS